MERTSFHTSSPSPCSTSGRPAAISTYQSFDRSSSSRRQVCSKEILVDYWRYCGIQEPTDMDMVVQKPRQQRQLRKELLVLAAAGEVRAFAR